MALLGNVAISIKKRSLLPVLMILFVFSYALMTMLIVEQGSTIQSQRALIQELFQDSVQLSGLKGKAAQERNMADAKQRAQAQAKTEQSRSVTPSANVPSAQAPLTQTPMAQTQKESVQNPSSQAVPQHQVQNHVGKTHKPHMQVPSRPASDLADERRALITI